MSISKSNWSRTSGIDTSIPIYDDPTISYDDSIEYYDGYNAATITTEDVKFDNWSATAEIPLNALWTPESISAGTVNGSPLGITLVFTHDTSTSSVSIPTTNWTDDG